MKKPFLIVAVLLFAGSAFAATTQKWVAGYDNPNEPLNYKKSKITWAVASRNLTVTYTLVSATARKLYQVDLEVFCSTFPSTFGPFPVAGLGSGNSCQPATRQGVTASSVFV